MSIIQDTLDKVTQLQQQKLQALSKVRNTTHRTMGRNLLAISPGEKTRLLNKVKAEYDQVISEVYADLNASLVETGQDLITNPFEKG